MAVRKVVELTPGAIGLAVIITNDYSTTSSLRSLPGAEKDGESLQEALADLKFAVHWKRNVNSGEFVEIIREISSLKHSLVKEFRCILFVFAGHGDEGDTLYMQDGAKLHLNQDVITPLYPEKAREIGNIKKAFLIDACRGNKSTETTLVPRSGFIPDESGERGGSSVGFEVPRESGIFIAHSTLPSHKSYEDKTVGGVWLSTVARLLKEKKYLFSLTYLLEKANEEIMESKNGSNAPVKEFQQPAMTSTLNGVIRLNPNSEFGEYKNLFLILTQATYKVQLVILNWLLYYSLSMAYCQVCT